MIVHTLDTITLRQYSKFEKTKDIKYLLRFPAPLFLTEKGLTKFFDSFSATFGEGRKDLEREKSKLIAYNKIILAQAILTGFQIHLVDKLAIDKTADLESLEYYIKEAENAFCLEIKTLEDVHNLKLELERMIDKFNEMFPKVEQKTEKGISMIQFALSVFIMLNLPFDNRMTLSEFAELKKLANEKAKQINDIKEKANGRH